MRLKGRRVLITGADGFIGSHLTELCVAEGAKVRAFAYYNSFGQWGWLDTLPRDTLRRIEVVSGDIRDAGFVVQAVDGMDTVFHLAALISIPYSYTAPESFVSTNINGTLNVLQACRSHRVRCLVHTSTSEVYGTAQYVPIDEKHALNPQSPYAASKSSADSLAMSFYCSYDLPVMILRPFNTFGPRQSARAVIPTIISQILSGRKTIQLGNLDSTRDLNYVGNTVDAFVHLAQCGKGQGEVFNTGSGVETSVGQVVEMVQEVLGTRVRIQQDRARLRPAKSEVERLVCNSAKLSQRTGWTPRLTLKQGLAQTCVWMKNHMQYYKPELYHV